MIDNQYILVCVAFLLSSGLYFIYKKIAVYYVILANPNYRTLHESPTPTGGGIVFAVVFIACLIFLWWSNKLSNDLFFVFGVGGSIAVFFGLLDDIFEIKIRQKLIGQFLLSFWVLFWFEGGPLANIDWIPSSIAALITLLFLVWVINAYNFMDGIDGMAVSGAMFASGSIVLVMLLTSGSSMILILSVLLLACSSAFMFFNWSPASIFMGDAGSLFLGYIFGAQIIYTTMLNEVSIYTWLIIFSYFIADTTATQIARLVLSKNWRKPHRSHAYQNIARIYNNHLRVTLSIIAYDILWLSPLLIWSVLEPDMAVIATILAMVPAFIVSFKYGPFFSSD